MSLGWLPESRLEVQPGYSEGPCVFVEDVSFAVRLYPSRPVWEALRAAMARNEAESVLDMLRLSMVNEWGAPLWQRTRDGQPRCLYDAPELEAVLDGRPALFGGARPANPVPAWLRDNEPPLPRTAPGFLDARGSTASSYTDFTGQRPRRPADTLRRSNESLARFVAESGAADGEPLRIIIRTGSLPFNKSYGDCGFRLRVILPRSDGRVEVLMSNIFVVLLRRPRAQNMVDYTLYYGEPLSACLLPEEVASACTPFPAVRCLDHALPWMGRTLRMEWGVRLLRGGPGESMEDGEHEAPASAKASPPLPQGPPLPAMGGFMPPHSGRMPTEMAGFGGMPIRDGGSGGGFGMPPMPPGGMMRPGEGPMMSGRPWETGFRGGPPSEARREETPPGFFALMSGPTRGWGRPSEPDPRFAAGMLSEGGSFADGTPLPGSASSTPMSSRWGESVPSVGSFGTRTPLHGSAHTAAPPLTVLQQGMANGGHGMGPPGAPVRWTDMGGPSHGEMPPPAGFPSATSMGLGPEM